MVFTAESLPLQNQPVALKVVGITGAAFVNIPMSYSMCVSLFSHPLLEQWTSAIDTVLEECSGKNGGGGRSRKYTNIHTNE